MTFTWEELFVWLVVGALSGSLAGLVVKRRKEGFGRVRNLGIGLAGALIGGVLFKVLRIDLGLANVSISLQDVVSAFVGALILLAGVWALKKQQAKAK
jgi:uncharacterized membrane protein YeaQ/YmgE (transglycosylase-associated protein family)